MDEFEEFPIGFEGHFTYINMEFDGEVVAHNSIYGILVRVYRGTGHTQEYALHNGNGTLDTNDYWFIGPSDMKKIKPYIYPTKPYDPTQGNEEGDV